MTLDDEQVKELQLLWPGAALCEEGGHAYLLIPRLAMPVGCVPTHADALLCVHQRDGYPSRLFFECVVTGRGVPNWNHQNVFIVGRAWNAFSWNVDPASARLAQIVRSFLRALE